MFSLRLTFLICITSRAAGHLRIDATHPVSLPPLCLHRRRSGGHLRREYSVSKPSLFYRPYGIEHKREGVDRAEASMPSQSS
ncbi:hypothetical protein BDP81DRAFT_419070 [Colletotrichum phormii]|uniref:Secreted protein n=1 Tax=Colletotrichum phormii TaxID=359342 RepID=A0AAJ0A095_9PEZI|nr:uncharacterized protein BDP81DRAFT_419070 [Colletotrichum phormii]KAK1641491.1 hypothetical protein BDP81DRAFT_419070 [Colletotrichum phormii]